MFSLWTSVSLCANRTSTFFRLQWNGYKVFDLLNARECVPSPLTFLSPSSFLERLRVFRPLFLRLMDGTGQPTDSLQSLIHPRFQTFSERGRALAELLKNNDERLEALKTQNAGGSIVASCRFFRKL